MKNPNTKPANAAREKVARLTHKRATAIVDLDLQISDAIREAFTAGNRYKDLREVASVRTDAELYRLVLPGDVERDVALDNRDWVSFSEVVRREGVSIQVVKTRIRDGELKLGYNTRGRKVVRAAHE